jgi:hypothetical protein
MATFTEKHNEGSLNDDNLVTIVDAPGAGARRLVRFISICNKDTAPVIMSLFIINTATVTPYTIAKVTLEVGETFIFGDGGETLVLDSVDLNVSAMLDSAVVSTSPDFVVAYAEVVP